jgi:hypothetical protein
LSMLPASDNDCMILQYIINSILLTKSN